MHLKSISVLIIKDLKVLLSIIYSVGDFVVELRDEFDWELRTEQLNAMKVIEVFDFCG